MSKDLVDDFDENPTTVSGYPENHGRRHRMEARSNQEHDESQSIELPYHADEYVKKLQNHGERIIQDLNIESLLLGTDDDLDDRRKTTTPRHRS